MSGPAWEHGGVTLHHGDAAEVLATLPDDSVDAIVTDPPYGLAEITTGMVAETPEPPHDTAPVQDALFD